MASVGFGTVAPSPAAAGGRVLGRRASRPASLARAPAATKVAAAAAKAEEQKGLFETIFGALYKEEQLLETDPILNKVEGKARAPAPAAKTAAGKKAAAAAEETGGGGFSLGGFLSGFKKG